MRLIDANALQAEYKERHKGKRLLLIDVAPTIEPEPQWIPCSERLPEMGQPVIDNYMSLNWLSFMSNGKAWTFERPDVIKAWMPLPEPYKGG